MKKPFYKVPAKALNAWPVHTIRGRNARKGPDVLEEWAEYKGVIQ